jgi:hypothetical protein
LIASAAASNSDSAVTSTEWAMRLVSWKDTRHVRSCGTTTA